MAKRSITFPQALWAAMVAEAEHRLVPVEVFIVSTMASVMETAVQRRLSMAPTPLPSPPLPSVPDPPVISVDDLPEDVERASTITGFAGVYPNGRGFKATFKGINLGTYPTVTEAAMARYTAVDDDRREAKKTRDALLAANGVTGYELPPGYVKEPLQPSPPALPSPSLNKMGPPAEWGTVVKTLPLTQEQIEKNAYRSAHNAKVAAQHAREREAKEKRRAEEAERKRQARHELLAKAKAEHDQEKWGVIPPGTVPTFMAARPEPGTYRPTPLGGPNGGSAVTVEPVDPLGVTLVGDDTEDDNDA